MALVAFSSVANGQSAFIRGIVLDASNNQPLEGANVVLRTLTGERLRGRATDSNGFYRLGDIDAGRYDFQITFVGYASYRDTVQIASGQNLTISVSLEPDEAQLDELVVASGGAGRLQGGVQQVSSIDLGRIPTPAGGGDLASYLQTMPGVVSTGDRGGQLFVRGGTPAQNLVLLDGTLIYQPFHILGFFSAFPEELVATADFYAGGFGPRYTDRISSVLDVKIRAGNRSQTSASGSVSPFLGEIVAEGPLIEGQSSWIGSFRRSLIEESSPLFLDETQPLHFESQFLKMSFFARQNSRCSFHGMRTYDRGRLDNEGDDTIKWTNFLMGGRCVVLPEGSDLLFDMNAGVSYVSNRAGNSASTSRHSQVTRANLDANISRYLDNVKLDYGLFVHITSLDYQMSELFGGPQTELSHLVNGGIHIQANIPWGNRLQLNPGAALTAYWDSYPASIEPRFRATWYPRGSDNEQLNLAGGIYRQSVTGISDKRDAGSAYQTWMAVPFGNSQVQAIHGLLGWQQTRPSGFQYALEGYYKLLDNLAVPERNSSTRFTTDLAPADGFIYGGDLRFEYRSGLFYGLVGYGYSWTEYETEATSVSDWAGDSELSFHPPHDQRHQVNALTSLTPGNYTFSLRWQLGSGFPFIQPKGFFEALPFQQLLPSPRHQPGNQRVITGTGRLPTSHRMDISAERQFEFPAGDLNLQLGAINLYNQENIFYYDVYNNRGVKQLPLVPYVSIKFQSRSRQ